MNDKLALRLVVMYEDYIRQLAGLCEEIILLTVAGTAEGPRGKLATLLRNFMYARGKAIGEPEKEEE